MDTTTAEFDIINGFGNGLFGALDSAVFTIEFNGNLAGITIPATATGDIIGFGTAVPLTVPLTVPFDNVLKFGKRDREVLNFIGAILAQTAVYFIIYLKEYVIDYLIYY